MCAPFENEMVQEKENSISDGISKAQMDGWIGTGRQVDCSVVCVVVGQQQSAVPIHPLQQNREKRPPAVIPFRAQNIQQVVTQKEGRERERERDLHQSIMHAYSAVEQQHNTTGLRSARWPVFIIIHCWSWTTHTHTSSYNKQFSLFLSLSFLFLSSAQSMNAL